MQTIDTPCLPEALLNTRHTHAVHTAYLVALLSMSLGGCATVKVPEPIGGSRADATVDLGFEFGQFEKPVINWDIGTPVCAASKNRRIKLTALARVTKAWRDS